MKTALEELSIALALRIQQDDYNQSRITQYHAELQAIAKTLGCSDSQTPMERLQEVLAQLSGMHTLEQNLKKVESGLDQANKMVDKLLTENEVALQQNKELLTRAEKYEEILTIVSDPLLSPRDSYQKIEEICHAETH